MPLQNTINFYLILNVSPQAKRDEIKKAYLKLAQAYHPDKNRGNKLAEKKFQQINQAWEILGDKKKRGSFDLKLQEIQKKQKQGGVFKSSTPSAPKAAKIKEKAIDLEIPLKVSLEDVCQSRSKTIHYFNFFNGQKTKESFTLQVPANVKPGNRLRFKNKGGAEGIKKKGDLYVKILFKSHVLFQLMGEMGDMLLNQPISFINAVQATKLNIPSPYGPLVIDLNPPVSQDQLLKVTGYGLIRNRDGKRGDLFVKILIDYPKNSPEIKQEMEHLSSEQKKQFVEKYQKMSFIFPLVLKFQKKLQQLKTK